MSATIGEILLDPGMDAVSIIYKEWYVREATFLFLFNIFSFLLRFLSEAMTSCLSVVSSSETPVLMAALILPPPLISNDSFQWDYD